jgi:hypothetical protein
VRHQLLDIRLVASRALPTTAAGVYLALVALFDLAAAQEAGLRTSVAAKGQFRSYSSTSITLTPGLTSLTRRQKRALRPKTCK